MLTRKTINTDLCVIGGGMSGICAAIAAARKGLKVVLMHERPVLGGNASSEIRMWICGAEGIDNRETGIIEEILLENLYRNPTKNYYVWDTVLYDFVIKEKNIKLLLNCTCMDAEYEEGSFDYGRTVKIKRATGYQLTTQTFIDVFADYFADCSGDSILAPLVNAEFMIGRESRDDFGEDTHVQTPDKMTMGMSCLIQGRETAYPVSFIPPSYAAKLSEEDFKDKTPDMNDDYENFWYLELGGERNTIDDSEEISHELAGLSAGTWNYIKNSGKYNADNWELDFLGFLPGKRESRRMTGEYIITQTDLSNNVVFEDEVAFGGWPLDDHFPGGFYHRGNPNTNIPTDSPYGIPYRALYSKNVCNLFFAGRNISATHFAMSSTRVMATCSVIGQAVGTAAAITHKYDTVPHAVYENHIEELQQTLMNDDCFLPHKHRSISILCSASQLNPMLYDGLDRKHTKLYGNDTCGISAKNGEVLEYTFDVPEYINSIHIVFDSDLNHLTLPGSYGERKHPMRCNSRLNSPIMHMPSTLCREFIITINTDSGTEELHITDNRKRSYHIDLHKNVSSIRLVPISNWGKTDSTNVFSFDLN